MSGIQLPSSIAQLNDTRTYALDKKDSFSSIHASFHRNKTIAAKNEQVLTSVVNQLKAQYPDFTFEPGSVSLPAELKTGKRAITGAEIKNLATTAVLKATGAFQKANKGAINAVNHALVAALPAKTMLQSGNAQPPKAEDLLAAIKKALPEGISPQAVKPVIMQASVNCPSRKGQWWKCP